MALALVLKIVFQIDERNEQIEDLNFPLHNLSLNFKTAIWNAKIRIKIQKLNFGDALPISARVFK